MTYLLDTSVCVDYLRRPDSPLRAWIDFTGVDAIRLCSIVKGELLVGTRKMPTERNKRMVSEFIQRFDSFPVDDDAAEAYAGIRAELEQKGQVISSNDMLIAAVALARGAILVTANPDEFRRVPSLAILTLFDLTAGKTPPA